MSSRNELDEVIQELSHFKLVLYSSPYNWEILVEALTLKVNDLISHDFPALVHLLYRLDISEHKLKELLKHSDQQAEIISKAIIDRQLQKIETRKAFKKDDNIAEDERW